VAAIDRLAVQQGADLPGVICDRDGWMALTGVTCPLCGEPTRATTDIIDELVEAVMDDSGSVKQISVDTPLQQHTLGARLRFPMPPKPPGT
jgi:peptide chain release factor subunit 1